MIVTYRGNFRFLAHNVLHVIAGLLWFCGLTAAGDSVHAIWAVKERSHEETINA